MYSFELAYSYPIVYLSVTLSQINKKKTPTGHFLKNCIAILISINLNVNHFAVLSLILN